jgi:HD-GYP domain-containing protein (c-di-GMP phosphodiesterase class II)
MTSDRPYRKAMSPTKAASILLNGRAQQWDAPVVDAFLKTIADQLEPDTIPQAQPAPKALPAAQAAYSTGL